MESIRAGDKSALEALYSRYSPFVLALCLRTIKDRAAAEEVMVDIFFELWNKCQRYDATRASPRTYLMTLARSRTIDALRSSARERAIPLDGQVIENLDRRSDKTAANAADNPAVAMAAGEQSTLIQQAMAKLEPDQRAAIEASYFLGLSHSEIAEKMNKPLGTIKSYIRMAMIQLRDSLRMDASTR